MKRIPFYVALAVLCLAMTDCTSKKKMEIKMKPYPQTAKVDVSDNYHGTVVADPYRGWRTTIPPKRRHGLLPRTR